MPTPPTLYHVPRTISSPLVQLLLELDLVAEDTSNTGVVRVKELSFSDLKTPAYLAINPMATSPAFTDDGIVLWESGAILDFLLEQHDTTHRFHPAASNRLQRAKYLNMKQYILTTFYPFVTKMFLEFRAEGSTSAPSVTTMISKYHTLYAPVLRKWLGHAPYFMGEHISAIDFLISKSLGNLHTMSLLEGALLCLYQRVTSRSSYRPAYEGFTQARATSAPGQPDPAATSRSCPVSTKTTSPEGAAYIRDLSPSPLPITQGVVTGRRQRQNATYPVPRKRVCCPKAAAIPLRPLQEVDVSSRCAT